MVESLAKYWIDEDVSEFGSLIDDQTAELGDSKNHNTRLYYLSKVRLCIRNLVCIYAGRDIDVQFKTKDRSYTDGEVVVLSASIHGKNLDSTVGLALHEASHILYSDFLLVRQLMIQRDKSIPNQNLKSNKIPQRYYDKSKLIGYTELDVNKFVKLLTNWVEDRRIDALSYLSSPGYVGYYHALYNRYFYNEVNSVGLKSPLYRKENMESYYYRVMNILHPHSDVDALQGLRQIYDLIDILNICRLEDTTDSLTLSLSIFDIILDNVTESKEKQKKPDEFGNGDGDGDGEDDSDSDGDIDSDEWDENADIKLSKDGKGKDGRNIPWDKLSDKQKQQIRDQLTDMIKEQKDLIDSESDSSKGEMGGDDVDKINLMNDNNATIKDIDVPMCSSNIDDIYDNEKYEVIIMDDIKEGQFFSNHYPFKCSVPQYSQSVEEGIRLGKILANKLRIRNEETPLIYNRMNYGKVDKRRLASYIGMNSQNIFKQTFVEKYCNAILHMSIDFSGSMGSIEKLGNALCMATAIAHASSIIKNMEVVISFRGSHTIGYENRYSDKSNLPLIAIVYDSRVDKISKIKNIFPYIKVCGGTPEGLCFNAIQEQILSSTKMLKSYFCNLSDGEPCFTNYSGLPAVRQTADEVRKMRLKGIKVLSYFIGGKDERKENSSNFKLMYGSDAKFIDPKDIISIAKTLNALFIDEKY